MTAIVPKFIASPYLFSKVTRISSTHPKVYSTLHPSTSPMFTTWRGVTNWFKAQSDDKRKAFHTSGYLTIYSYELALCDRTLPSGESVKKGQAINVEEFKVYDFNKRTWL